MGAYRGTSRKENISLLRTFPMLKAEYGSLDEQYFAGMWRISIFDHYLELEEARELIDSVVPAERTRRDVLWHAFNRRLIESTPCYGFKWVRAGKPKFLQPRSRQQLLEKLCCPEPREVLALPTFGCIYQQYWDDTNLLYFKDATRVQPFVRLAAQCGLHVLT
jgi:hypothetical protein